MKCPDCSAPCALSLRSLGNDAEVTETGFAHIVFYWVNTVFLDTVCVAFLVTDCISQSFHSCLGKHNLK